MSRGTMKSRWVETEVERKGKLYLLPLRCRLEARGQRIRTVIETFSHESNKWVRSHKTAWIQSDNAGRIPESRMDEAAQEIADTLIKDLEAGPIHPDWYIGDINETHLPTFQHQEETQAWVP